MVNTTDSNLSKPQSEIKQALLLCKSAFISVGIFSLFINLLLLIPSIYMLQVYDRVMASSSESTLLMLTLITLFLLMVMGGLEWTRSQIMNVTGNKLDNLLNSRIYNALFSQSLTSGKGMTAQPLTDLQMVRQFLTGPGLFAFFDAPWLPIFIVLLFLFHPYFGLTAIISALILTGFAVWNEYATKDDLENASKESIAAQQMTQANLRNAEVIDAMGMLPQVRERWRQRQNQHLDLQLRANAKGGLITALSKFYRLSIQSLILGLGAYLSIHREITPGLVVAGSILMGRALAPIDQIIAQWRSVLMARDAYHRLDKLLFNLPNNEEPMLLPPLVGEIRVENCVIIPPGLSVPVIKGINFAIPAGSHLAIVGPSAAGKSTLIRALLGIYAPSEGAVRFDGAEVRQWNKSQLGNAIGYLPQDVELLDGSIGENIARFGIVDPEKVVAAAKHAGIHDMILHLPEAYNTRIEGSGYSLSAGQRQRLGLARALYGEPKVFLLDEPNSNLDQEGEMALQRTLQYLKQTGRTVIIITHRSNILAQMDYILILANGEIMHFGFKEDVLAALQQQPQKPVEQKA
ncbi:type I secretion system permease/ATPase [Methylomonas sp. AM2-LC]|uniref:type I secretion system permease/ATPase n=1 Tax=Methylomonas sp. AM2-LC TaxID=3153301 RepID=UPI003266B21B